MSEHVHQSPSLNPTLHICKMGWFDLFIQTQFPSTLVTDAIGCPEVNSTFFTLVWRMRPPICEALKRDLAQTKSKSRGCGH